MSLKQGLIFSIGLHLFLATCIMALVLRAHILHEQPIEVSEIINHLLPPNLAQKTKPKSSATLHPKTSNTAISSSSTQSSGSSVNSSNSKAESVAESYEVGEMPVLLNEVRIPYPPEAKIKGIQGSVVFDLIISSEGNVADAKLISSPDAMLSVAAANAIKKFKFRPAKKDNKSVAIKIRYSYRFVLQ